MKKTMEKWKIIFVAIAMIPLGLSSNYLYSQVVPGVDDGCEHDACQTNIEHNGPPQGPVKSYSCVPADPANNQPLYKNCDAEADGCEITDC